MFHEEIYNIFIDLCRRAWYNICIDNKIVHFILVPPGNPIYHIMMPLHRGQEVIMSETNTFIKLPESELEVMQAIWALHTEGEKFISASLIMKRFPALCRLKLTTVLTLITRLQTKGFISIEKLGRANCYTPLIDVGEYREFVANDFVERVYAGNQMRLIANLLNSEKLTAEEIATLKQMIAAM